MVKTRQQVYYLQVKYKGEHHQQTWRDGKFILGNQKVFSSPECCFSVWHRFYEALQNLAGESLFIYFTQQMYFDKHFCAQNEKL